MINYLREEFIEAMQENMSRGVKDGRKAHDWVDKDFDWADDRFAAIHRHLYKYSDTDNPKHLAAVACNAMMVWYHHKKGTFDE
jgi:hypothetical protein